MASRNARGRPRKITLDMVLAATSLTRSSTESTEAYLGRVTHLHLQAKRIRRIEELDLCTNLKVLYLYDNQIELVENLEFATNLQYLQLQNNFIKEIPPLQIPHLAKLFVDDNEITFVTGLENCTKLEELHIANQRMPSFSSLTFDPPSLDAISGSLQVLEISGNGISILAPFTILTRLRRIVCINNLVADVTEVEAIVGLYYIAEANFSNNPCCSILKYRDYVIAASSDSLRVLDDVPVLRHQQIAMRGLMAHRQKIGAAFPTASFTDAVDGAGGTDLLGAEEDLGLLDGDEGKI